MVQSTTVTRIVRLTENDKGEVADLFARVFAGPPWFEVMKCSICEEAYGKGDDLERFRDGIPCRRCGNPLKLVEYWRDGSALEVYDDALTRPGFIGIGARNADGKLIGLSWGFTVPETDSPSVHFGAVAEQLRKRGFDPFQTFYASETGVDPDYQGLGIGTRIMHMRLLEARDAGFVRVCFRTINPKLVERYERFFGEDYVRPMFNDPDPVKSDRTWYISPFARLGAVNRYPVDRFEEYKIVLDDINRLSDRRQRTNELFMALNGLLLTALGVLLFSSRLTTWWLSSILSVVSILAMFINGIWLRIIRAYLRVAHLEVEYACGIENLIGQSGADKVQLPGGQADFGILSLVFGRLATRNRRLGYSNLEIRLASLLILVYPMLALIVAGLTYLIVNGYLPPFSAN